MARIARVVVPGLPHHITQRGNRRQDVFFQESDYERYILLLREWCDRCKVQIWAYCLMPNHVHLIAVPETEESLSRGIGEAHRRYTRMINFREGWRGYLWQGRFASYPMDERYLISAVRYIELNPLRAKMVSEPWEYAWSSAYAHINGKDDRLARVQVLLEMVGDWKEFLLGGMKKEELEQIRCHSRTGRPLGDASFIARLEVTLGRVFCPQKVGRKPSKIGIVSP
ncbi:MAG: transposase [Candidatus Firestonebacteria bacterium]